MILLRANNQKVQTTVDAENTILSDSKIKEILNFLTARGISINNLMTTVPSVEERVVV
ncbi:MAG: hypothetical protein KI790_18140 [Cyclobacteriaceae bacterium]|nr:hypothetical protein [Cyclobacteriaceae bacterium HetDA_MAG_MS6]